MIHRRKRDPLRGRNHSRDSDLLGTTPIPFADVALSFNPRLFFVLDQSGIQDPVDTSGNAAIANLNAPYVWGGLGPVPGKTSLALSGGNFTIGRVGLTGSQTRIAFVNLSSTKSSATYEGDAPLTISGDSSGSVWDSFGISNGKVQYNRFNNSVWQSFTGTRSVNDGSWHMIASTYDSVSRVVSLYVDGLADGGGTMTSHQAQGGINVFGKGFNAADNYVGSLAELLVYNTALSSDNIATIWYAS